MFKEFKDFAVRGSVVDMAVGIVIGAAFGAIVNSLVSDILMPPIGLLLGKVDFNNLFLVLKEGTTPGPYASLVDAQTVGAVSLNYGFFINKIISFVIIAFALFIVIRGINRLKKEQEVPPAEPTTMHCPYCLSQIPLNASRCAFCTSEIVKRKG
jgi:large conductance mechanosensitive channel